MRITLLLIWKTGGLQDGLQSSPFKVGQDLDLSELTDDTLVLRALRIFRLLRILPLGEFAWHAPDGKTNSLTCYL